MQLFRASPSRGQRDLSAICTGLGHCTEAFAGPATLAWLLKDLYVLLAARLVINFRAGLASFAAVLLGPGAQFHVVWRAQVVGQLSKSEAGGGHGSLEPS